MASPLAPEPPGRCSAGPGNLNNNNNNNQPPPPQQEPPQQQQQQPPQEPPPPPPGVRKCGYLRKHKHGHKRFFVLRAPIAGSGAAGGPEGSGSSSPPARLEYYESEKKWRSKSGAPKRSIALDAGLNVHKRADAKHKHLVALYTRDEYVALAAESEQEQEAWYQAIAELLRESQPPPPPPAGSPRHPLQATVAGSEDSGYGPPGGGGGWGAGAGASGGSAYREVWQVTLKPKGLGQSRHLTGVHRLCLAARTVGLVRLNCERPCVTLQLMNIRRCGHSDSFFFMELGRSASTGPGELWMQADDSVVAQNIHETILEAMKALRELAEFRPRSKSQSSSSSSGGAAAASAAATGRGGGGGGGGGGGLSLMCSRPISVPGPRRHPRHPCTALPPSQTGLLRRSRTDILAGAGGASGLSAAAATTTTNTRARTASEGDGFRVASLSGSGSPLSPDSGPPSRSHLPPGRSLPLGQAPSWVSKVAGEVPGVALSQPRPSGSSASGSPSDVAAAFLAFEDLDSSPVGNPRPSSSLTAANNIHTPDTPPGQHLGSSYIAMDRGHLCYSSGRCESAGRDMGPRKRTCSLTTPAHQHLLPLPHSSTSLDDYTLLRATLPPAGCSPRAASIPYPEDYCDVEIGSGSTSSSSSSHLGYSAGKEEGYMPMAPRILSVLPLQGDPDGYMSMSPTSMSPPQSVLHPVPSRIGSESSSDDSSYMHMWGTNSRLSGENLEGRSTSGGDYISMSPVSVPSSTSNGFGALGPGIQSSPSHAFWNRATFLGESKDSDQYVFMNSLAVNHTVCNNTTMPLPMCHSRTESSLSQPANSVQPSPLFLGLFLPSINEPRASSGEYVNIGYSQVPPVSDSSTSLFGTGMEGHHRSRFSDYMNLNFEGLQSGATSVGSLEEGLLSGSSPSSGQPDKREVKGGMQETCLSSSFSEASDYTEMLFTTATPPPQPISHQPESTQATSPITGLKQLTLSEMETFLFASPPPDPNYGAKVIRADPQGRRRHSSETFSSTTMVTPVSPSFAHNSKWHNSASVENVSLRKSEDFVEEQNSSPMCRETSAGFQNGLNYIAVNVLDGDHLLKGKHASGSPLNGSISGTYTTVDFLAHNLKETSLVKE